MSTESKYKGVRGNFKTISIGLSDFNQVCIGTDAQREVLAHIYLPDYVATPETKAVAELMAGSLKMFELLEKLSGIALPDGLNDEINAVLDHVTDLDKPQEKFDFEKYKRENGLS